MAIITELKRVFRFGATDLPDPDKSWSPERVLQHYQGTFPQLVGGKIQGGDVEGDAQVFVLKRQEYKANG